MKINEKHRRYSANSLNKAFSRVFFVFLIFSIAQIGLVSAFDWNDDDLVAYYKLDNSTGAVIDVVNGINGTNNGATRGATGKINNAFDFEVDESDWVNLTYDINSDYMSISVWVKTESVNGADRTILGHWQNSGTDQDKYVLRIEETTGYAEAILKFANGTTITHKDNQNLMGGWHHIVLTSNLTSSVLYVDGEARVNGTGGDELANSPNYPTCLGSLIDTAVAEFDGLIDEVGFWNRSLSRSEVVELYNSGNGLPYNGGAISTTFTVTLTSPTDSITTSNKNNNLSATYNISTNLFNWTNVTYYIWYDNGTVFNNSYTEAITGVNNDTKVLFYNFSLDAYYWNVYACYGNATLKNCTWADNGNYTLEVGASIDSTSYNASVWETDSEEFIANITLVGGANLYAARLVYNGTSYLATKTSIGTDRYKLSRTIDIPVINTTSNITFYWNFEFRNGGTSSQNSTTYTHTVNELIFVSTNSTYPIKFINYTVYNETSLTVINSEIDASFDYWLGSGTVKKIYSLSSSSYIRGYNFSCNRNDTLYINAVLNVKANGTNERTFYFNLENYTNTTTYESLYLQDGGTSIIVQVKDQGLVPVEGDYVKVYRYYPEDDKYRIVERAKTDEYGQFVSRLIEPNTVKYQFEFLSALNVIKKRTDDMTIACRSAICVLPFVIEDTTDDFARFDNITDYTWTFTFDNSTNTFTFTWNDVSGVSATNWLKVERYLINGTTLICNSTSILSSGSLTCAVGSSEGSYQAQIFRKVGSGDYRRISILSKVVGTTFATYGKEGLIWSFFLLMTMIVIGYWYPPVGIVLHAFGSLALYLTKIIYVNPGILFAQFLIVVVFCWAFGGRRR